MRNVAQASITALLLLAMTFAAAAPAEAIVSSSIRVRNETDKYVWVTAYKKPSGGSAMAVLSWCIAPAVVDDSRGFAGEIKEVRVEVSADACQRNPMLLDKTLYVEAREVSKDKTTFWSLVRAPGGVLTFTH